MRQSVTRIIILGGGYAGVRAAHDLARSARRNVLIEIILIANTPYHIDAPTLYEVATAYLPHESTDSSEMIGRSTGVLLEDIFHGEQVTILIKTVRDIQPADRLISFTDGTTMSFDFLVIALGAVLATYGIPGVAKYAFSIKDTHAALELRHHIVRNFIMAKNVPVTQRAALLSIVIVGAGAAGVETAAELCGDVRKLCRKYGIEPTVPRITLIEAGPDILTMVVPHLRAYTSARLTKLGVRVMVARPVAAVEDKQVVLVDDTTVSSATTIWTGGLAVHPVLTGAELPLARHGVAVTDTMQVKDHANIFAAGDCAIVVDYPEKIPGAVPIAYGQGVVVAQNIINILTQRPLQTYRYRTLGALITIGGKSAIAVFPGGRGITGMLPWVIKRVVTLHYWLGYLSWWEACSFWWRSLTLHNQND